MDYIKLRYYVFPSKMWTCMKWEYSTVVTWSVMVLVWRAEKIWRDYLKLSVVIISDVNFYLGLFLLIKLCRYVFYFLLNKFSHRLKNITFNCQRIVCVRKSLSTHCIIYTYTSSYKNFFRTKCVKWQLAR